MGRRDGTIQIFYIQKDDWSVQRLNLYHENHYGNGV